MFYNLIIQFQLKRRLIYGKQRTCVTHVHTLVAQAELHLGGQLQQAKEICHRSTLFSYALAQALLSKIILVNQLLERKGYLDCI